MMETGNENNYFMVPAAMRELGKVEMIRQVDGDYRLDHAVTGVCKDLFNAFGINGTKVKASVREIARNLKNSEKEYGK